MTTNSIKNVLCLAEYYSTLRTICIMNIIAIGYAFSKLITAFKAHGDISLFAALFILTIVFQAMFISFFRKTKKEYEVEKHKNRRI
jgi:hypothetical protein